MKRMVYVIVAATTLVVIAAIMTGCFAIPAKKEKPPIEGISLHQNHMDYSYCYSFYLRKDGEKVLFDADFAIDEEPYRIILEGCEVDASYMDKLKELDEANGISDYVSDYKETKSPVEILDDTVVRTTVYFTDGTDKSANSGAYSGVLYEFFSGLALEYKAQFVETY